jgi:hypothetical protein
MSNGSKKVWIVIHLTVILFLFTTQLNAKNLWWLQEYPHLIELLKRSPNQTLKASYNTGPQGDQLVSIEISLMSNKSFVLEMKLPKHAVVTVDPNTGKSIPVSIDPIVKMRDNDLDGILDEFKMQPGRPPEGVPITQDGYMVFRNTKDYEAIFLQWVFSVGYSVNHFLHGRESALPRRE